MTQEEIIQAISDDKMMPFIQPEQLANIVEFVIKNYQPGLPSNLDEAAEKAGLEYAPKQEGEALDANGDVYATDDVEWPSRCGFMQGFKAGAEWMAGQGETHETEIIESVPYGGTKWKRCVKVWLDDQFQAKGDKVLVQIRKK